MSESLRVVPLPLRWALIGGVFAGLVGGIIGLIVGLRVYPPTAWFAVFELGVPAGMLGAIIGLVAGSIAFAVLRLIR
jgi:hypothetical protein